MTERELLSEYIASGSPQAFAELVRQNADMVYTAARRQVGDADLAQEVAQAVFILLARKSAAIKGPLAGWLIFATYYAARNARKLAARRRYHERRAGQMKLRELQTPPDTQWESYAPALDEAMARLSSKDRDAIAMRYFRGLSLREVGSAMGISEEAARKRVDRGLFRLRGILSARTTVPAVAIMATHLAARGSEAAPANVTQAIIASVTSGKGSFSAAIASKTAGAMSSTGLKVSALVAAFILLAGVSIGLVVFFSSGNPSPPPPPVSQATLSGDESELHVPGNLVLVRWDAALNEQGARAVRRICLPMQTPSRIYEANLCNATQLRHTIASEMDNGGVESIEAEPYTAFDTEFGGVFEFDHITKSISFSAQDLGEKEKLQRLDNDHIKVTLNLQNISIDLYDMQTQRKTTAAMTGQATLAAGDSLAFLGSLNTGTGANQYHLIVYEAFHATSQQADYSSMLYEAGWWCRNGPTGLRQLADIAQVWKSQVAHKPFLTDQLWNDACDVPAPFEKPTLDGQTVRLVAISRPDKWRYCWWDAFGKPTVGDDMWLNYRTQNEPRPPAGTWAMVQVVGPPVEAKLATPTGRDVGGLGPDNIFRNIECEKIDDGPAGCDVGVLVGPWIEIAQMKWGETKTVKGVIYQIPPPSDGYPSDIVFNLKRTGVLENEDFLTAVTKEGTEVECWGSPRQISITGRNSSPRTVEDEIRFPFTKDKVAYFRILQRKRQWIHFNGFATEPDPLPPQNVTADEVQHANNILRVREDQQRESTTRKSES